MLSKCIRFPQLSDYGLYGAAAGLCTEVLNMHDTTNTMFNSVSAPPGLEPPGSEDRRIHHGSGLAPSGSAGAVRWPTNTSLAPAGPAGVLGKTDGPLLYDALFSSGLKPYLGKTSPPARRSASMISKRWWSHRSQTWGSSIISRKMPPLMPISHSKALSCKRCRP